MVYIFWDLPSVDSLSANLTTPSIHITDRNGRPLYDILPSDAGRNAVLSFDHIPQCMKDATIAVEDKNFYQNPGIDIEGIVRALWIDIPRRRDDLPAAAPSPSRWRATCC